jgi:hypothetical protein
LKVVPGLFQIDLDGFQFFENRDFVSDAIYLEERRRKICHSLTVLLVNY